MHGRRDRNDLTKLVIGNGVSTFGNAVYLISMILLFKELYDSAFLLGLFQFLALVPGAILSPLVGIIVDSVSRRLILVVSDIARGLVMIAAAAILRGIDIALLAVPARSALTSGLLGVALLLGIGHAFFVPAAQALIPAIVPQEKLQNANGLRAATNQSFNLAGNAAAGALYVFLGPALLFAVNGLTFLISGLGELWITERGIATADREKRPQSLAAIKKGFDAVRRDPLLMPLFLSQFGLFLFSPTLLLALPFIVIDELQRSETELGLIFAVSLAGGIVLFLALRRTTSARMLQRPYPAIAYSAVAVSFIALFLGMSMPVVTVAAFVLGAAAAAVYIYVTTAIQFRVPADLHGRLFALLEAGSALIAPVAYVATGALLDAFGSGRRRYLFAVWAVFTLVWALMLFRGFHRDQARASSKDR